MYKLIIVIICLQLRPLTLWYLTGLVSWVITFLYIYIYDLPNYVQNSLLLLFANDSKIQKQMQNDKVLLQSDVDAIVK